MTVLVSAYQSQFSPSVFKTRGSSLSPGCSCQRKWLLDTLDKNFGIHFYVALWDLQGPSR